jgi:hypothetical protein
MSHNTFGNFGSRSIVDAFQADLEAIPTTEHMYGLPLQIQYLYGFLETADGKMYSPERKFNGSLTGGLYFMGFDGNTLEMHPGTGTAARGELKRKITPGHRLWHQPIFYNLPEGVARPGELDFVLELKGNHMTYIEGDLFQLEGELQPLGVQHYTPMRHEALYYTNLCYWMTGTVLGQKAEGVLFFDNAYWEHSIEWKEYAYYGGGKQVSWQIFGNKLDDGTIQWGPILQGDHGFSPAIILEGDKVVAQADSAITDHELDDSGFVIAAHSQIGDTMWEFRSEEKGYMESFSRTRWQNYLAQLGKTRLVGDHRQITQGYTWIEHFPDRIQAVGRAKKLDGLVSQS